VLVLYVGTDEAALYVFIMHIYVIKMVIAIIIIIIITVINPYRIDCSEYNNLIWYNIMYFVGI